MRMGGGEGGDEPVVGRERRAASTARATNKEPLRRHSGCDTNAVELG